MVQYPLSFTTLGCSIKILSPFFVTLGPLRAHELISKAIVFKKKLQLLKSNLKDWRKLVNSIECAFATSLREKISLIDFKAQIGPLTSDEVMTRAMSVKELANLEYSKAKDLRQKSKSKWALEGDEKLRFFHGIINNKMNRSRINGPNIQGSWVTDPICIKNHILHSFELKFKKDTTQRPSFSSNLFKQISSSDSSYLDEPFSDDEIKDTVWNYGSDKSPGPDGFTFKLFKKYWDVIGGDILLFVKEFKTTSSIQRGCSSSFFTLVPKVKDPIVICDFRPISLIGYQYKIIAKVLANWITNVISSVVGEVQMDFIKGRQISDGPLMTKWIHSCLDSSYASIHINGSPNLEFKLHRGLRQEVGVDKVHVSHLQFADDALILGDWSKPVIENLSRILTYFHLGSGLKVNFNKSKALWNCFKAPKTIIIKREGIRRKFFWGESLDTYKIPWIAWNKVISSPKQGDLGIGSLVVSNHALLAKWWWRFLIEDNALWCKVIGSIHGSQGGLHDASLIRSKPGPWY
nr:RNA-directed DNA polymerase, eukaryota [Tanacetum cinerariifolium]